MLMLSLLVGAAAALDSESSLPQTFGDFTFSRLETTNSGAPLSRLQITDNVLTLQRAEARSLSSIFVQAMRRGDGMLADGVSRPTNGSTTLLSVEGGQVFLAAITVGGQNFNMVIDSGSSDPWLVTNGFTCYDVSSGMTQDESQCNFGPLYNASASSTYSPVSNQNFNISYADGEKLSGAMGYESMTMANITVPRQQFGVVNIAGWFGDGYSSGLIGFAYRTLTSAYAGNDPSKDVKGNTLPYNPLFVNMYTNQGVPPVFSLAINRDASNAGLLALGGIPNIPHSPSYVSTPIIPVGVNSTDGSVVYEFYTIAIDGFAFARSSATQFNAYNNPNPRKTTLAGNGTDVIVDSGTSLAYVPNDVAAGVAAAFTPAATYDTSLGAYVVSCTARPPVFGVGISRKVFYVNAADMIIQISQSQCISGVQPNHGGLTILGAMWMKNVIAVFDIGAEMMRFAARQYFGLTSTSIRAHT